MCGRFFLARLVERVADEFGATITDVIASTAPSLPSPNNPRYNIAPSQRVLVVRAHADGERRLAPVRWGLIPHWSRDESIGSRLINARSETAREKPAYRDAMRHRRCLVPADGFYEWKRTAGSKRPMLIRRADGRSLAMGGLWESWSDPQTENTIETLAVLTCAPNALMGTIHDRMPVLLEPEHWDAWLDPATDMDAIAPMLAPAPDGVLKAHPVSSRVNSPSNDDPGLIEPVEDTPDTLFG